jgi:hypothetical protein
VGPCSHTAEATDRAASKSASPGSSSGQQMGSTSNRTRPRETPRVTTTALVEWLVTRGFVEANLRGFLDGMQALMSDRVR